ncbi:MAG: hypothetical protein WC423_10845 [Vulcanimicrobiota bacterium]
MRWRSFKSFLLTLMICGSGLAEDVRVTGAPATPDFLKSVLQAEGWNHWPARSLAPGESWKSPSGDRVINLDWVPPEPIIVALSDHPEKVERRGGLFFGGLTPYRTLLFQYYHLGKLVGAAPHLTLVVQNSGSEPAVIHLQQGIGNTSLDYFSSGHTNNVRWFAAVRDNLGVFKTIPPGQTVELFHQPLPLEQVVSGTLGLTQTRGAPLSFALVARPNLTEQLSLNNLLKQEDVHSRGFYPVPEQWVRRHYSPGQDPLHIAIGAVRQQTFSGVRELRGDYGVTYRADLTLSNPGSSSRQVELVFVHRGGAATGTFTVNGEIVEVPIVKAFEERVFFRTELPPHSTRDLVLKTIPEGASSYPVRIVVREGKS